MLEQLEHLLARGLLRVRSMFQPIAGRRIAGFEPFIGDEQNRLPQIDGGKLFRRRNGDDGAGERDFVVLQSRALIAEKNAAALAARDGLAQQFHAGLRRIDLLGETAPPRRRRQNELQITDAVLQTRKHARIVQHIGGAHRHHIGARIRPAVARLDETQITQTEIRHSARRGANIFAQLGVAKDDAGRVHGPL